jgi:hypothetical protein
MYFNMMVLWTEFLKYEFQALKLYNEYKIGDP